MKNLHHIIITPIQKSQLQQKQLTKEEDTLPPEVGHFFKSKEEIKEESDRDFFNLILK